MSMLPKPSAVVFAKNLTKVARFYEDVAVMSVIRRDIERIVLDCGAMQLVIHGIPKHIADSIDITVPPALREGMPVKICMPVPSLADSRIMAAACGGGLDAKEEEWHAGGFRACDGYDPEGNVVQFRESAAP